MASRISSSSCLASVSTELPLSKPSQPSIAEQLEDAIIDDWEIYEHVTLCEENYEIHHKQIHYLNERIRLDNLVNNVGWGPSLLDHFQEMKEVARSRLEERQEKWTAALKEITEHRRKVSQILRIMFLWMLSWRQIDKLRRLLDAERQTGEEIAVEGEYGSEEEDASEEDIAEEMDKDRVDKGGVKEEGGSGDVANDVEANEQEAEELVTYSGDERAVTEDLGAEGTAVVEHAIDILEQHCQWSIAAIAQNFCEAHTTAPFTVNTLTDSHSQLYVPYNISYVLQPHINNTYSWLCTFVQYPQV